MLEQEANEEDDERQEIFDFHDPLQLTELPVITGNVPRHPALASVIKSEWRFIRSYMLRINKNMRQYNLRWATPTRPRLRQFLEGVFSVSRTPFFLMAMAGFYLAYNDVEAGLFYAEENSQIFANPSKIASRADLERYLDEWPSTATIIRDFKHYFDTEVKVLGMANVLFLVVMPEARQPPLVPR